MKKLLFMLFVTAIVFAVGCQKEEMTQEKIHESKILTYKDVEIKLIDGRLLLESVDDVTYLRQDEMIHPNDLRNWTENIPGFESAMSAFEKINFDVVTEELKGIQDIAYFNDIDGKKVIDPVIDDPIFRYLANHKGIFQLKEKVYKLYRDNLVSVTLEDFNKTGLNTFKMQEVITKQPIVRKTIYSGNIESRAQVDNCNSYYDGGTMRVNGRIEENNDFWTNWVYCRVESRNYRNGRSNPAEELSLDWAFTISDDYGVVLKGGDATEEEVSYIGRTFHSGPNATITDSDCIHTAVDNGGLSGSCTTYDD